MKNSINVLTTFSKSNLRSRLTSHELLCSRQFGFELSGMMPRIELSMLVVDDTGVCTNIIQTGIA